MYRAAVIGLGNIAAMYSRPEDTAPYCHVGGIRQCGRVQLAAVCDLLEEKREAFRKRWGGCFPRLRYFDSMEAMFAAGSFDIVAICVRGPAHFDVTMRVIEAGPRAIFLEKPPTCSLQEMDLLLDRAGDIPIVVSYSRHWGPHLLRLSELIRDGMIGEVDMVVAYCGQGVLSYASHTTDLICQFAGYEPASVMANGRCLEGAHPPDGYEPEPELDAMTIQFKNGVVGVQVGRAGEHGEFYCDVIGTRGRLRAGFYIPPFAVDGDGKEINLDKCGMPLAESPFAVAYRQIAGYLDGAGPLPDCANRDFAMVHEVGFAAIESLHSGRRTDIPVSHRMRRVFANG